MSAHRSAEWDERTQAVVTASYRWGYTLLTYGLLIDVAYRGLFRHEAAWDLMVLVIAGGAVCTVYQVSHRILGKAWVRGLLVAWIAGAIAAAGIVVCYAMGLLR